MSKKAKKIPVNQLEKALGNIEATTVLKINELEVEVRRFIGLQDMVQFVYDTVDPCFLEDGTYVPEVRWPAFSIALIDHFTNIKLPENNDKRMAILYGTDLVGDIVDVISPLQYDVLSDAVDEKIQHLLDLDVKYNRAILNDAVEKFMESQDKLSDAFYVLTAEDVKNMSTAFSGGKIDEQKIVDAIVKQMRSEEENKEE